MSHSRKIEQLAERDRAAFDGASHGRRIPAGGRERSFLGKARSDQDAAMWRRGIPQLRAEGA